MLEFKVMFISSFLKSQSKYVVVLLILLAASPLIVWKIANIPPDDVTLKNGAKLEWDSCWFKVPLFKVVHCAFLYPSTGAASTPVKLPIVVLRDYFSSQDNPLLYINGGPGYATFLGGDGIDGWLEWKKEKGLENDLVLFDQRGTGLSVPKPECKGLLKDYKEVLSKNLSQEKEYSFYYDKMNECYKKLVSDGHDLSSYSTQYSASDVDDLMRTISSDNKWNIYGVSYGSRLAIEVMQKNPELIRSVVLDSVYPPNHSLLLKWPYLLNNSLDNLFQGCIRDSECNELYPGLKNKFRNALSRLKKEPLILEVDDWAVDGKIKVVINDHRFIMAVYYALYQWDQIEHLPKAIYSILNDTNDSLLFIIESYVNVLLDKDLNDVIYSSVECNDQQPVSRERYMDEVRKYPFVKRYTLLDWDYDICSYWLTENNMRNKRIELNTTAIPTLLLSGIYDPVTPVEWMEKDVYYFIDGIHLIIDGIGHGVLDSDYCAAEAVKEFFVNSDNITSDYCIDSDSPPDFK